MGSKSTSIVSIVSKFGKVLCKALSDVFSSSLLGHQSCILVYWLYSLSTRDLLIGLTSSICCMQVRGSCYHNSLWYLLEKELTPPWLLSSCCKIVSFKVPGTLPCKKIFWFSSFQCYYQPGASLLLRKVPNSKDRVLVTRVLLTYLSALRKALSFGVGYLSEACCEGRTGLYLLALFCPSMGHHCLV